jgi:hypothetical protein
MRVSQNFLPSQLSRRMDGYASDRFDVPVDGSGQAVHRRGLRQLVQGCCNVAGLPHGSTHGLRKACATTDNEPDKVRKRTTLSNRRSKVGHVQRK